MTNTAVIVIAFAVLMVLIVLRTPIFAALGVAGMLGIYLARGEIGLTQLPFSIMSQLNNFTLVAIPLFILMGEFLFITDLGRDLYDAFNKWLSWIPGRLAVASIFSSALFGAMCGVSIAAVAVIGTMAMPAMKRFGYDDRIAAGSIAASGALAMLIPPSLLFILYGSISGVSVGKLFIGGIIPGIVLAVAMALYVVIRVLLNPQLAPRTEETITWRERFATLSRLWPAILLIIVVLGSIYTGVTTPTESAAIGVAGAFLIATLVYRALNLNSLRALMGATMRTTASILIIMASAFIFSQFLLYTRVPEIVSNALVGSGVPPLVLIVLLMALFVVLGMFIDAASMVLVTTPIFLPAIINLGYDPLWFGIILVINLEMAVITPPVGLNLYTLKTVAPQVRLEDIIAGSLPYVIIDFAVLLLFVIFPEWATWLPNLAS